MSDSLFNEPDPSRRPPSDRTDRPSPLPPPGGESPASPGELPPPPAGERPASPGAELPPPPVAPPADADSAPGAIPPPPVAPPPGQPAEPTRRMRLLGLHHVTTVVRDLDATSAFYRDVLGLTLVQQGENADDPGARHFWFGDPAGTPGTLVSFLEYPQMGQGTVGVGSTHHFAFGVASAAELAAWRTYLTGRGVECTDVLVRGGLRSLYVRDPDGHIVEIATSS